RPFCRLPTYAATLGMLTGFLPCMGLYVKRKRRLASFGKQLPEALELIGRALRAGHSLASGFKLVADEMPAPIGTEFERCYEAQNLGVSLEDAIEEMTNRVPNLDLRFFATAVILQRQTGGDLAEILDKIGHLVRERFIIWGQIQSLIGALAWLAVDWLGAGRSRAEQRLADFKDPLRKRREEAGGPGKKKQDAMARMLEASAPALAKPLQPKTEQAMSKLKLKLSYAGFRSEAASQIFLGLKFIMLVVGVVIGGGTTIALLGISQGSIFRVVMLAGGMF